MSTAAAELQCQFETIEQSFENASGAWIGCDWPTSFGQSRLDLNGISSQQALLMARATAGQEEVDWREAVEWLRQIETDASAAEEAGAAARDHAGTGDLYLALQEASLAARLEAPHHSTLVWADLRDAIIAARSRR